MEAGKKAEFRIVIVDIEKLGKKYKAIVPDDSPESKWIYGVIIGPPDLDNLGLPHSIEVRLHNELFNRGLITKADLHKSNLVGALQAAYKVDVQRLEQLYWEAPE